MLHLHEAALDPVVGVGAVGDLNAGVGQHDADPIAQRLQQVAQNLCHLNRKRPG